MNKEDIVNEISTQMGIDKPTVLGFMEKLRELTIDALRYGENVTLWPGVKFTATLVPAYENYDPVRQSMEVVPEHYVYKARFTRYFKDMIRGGKLNDLKENSGYEERYRNTTS